MFRMCKRVLFQLGIKKGKLCLDKMYIIIYICIYKAAGMFPRKKGRLKMKKNKKEFMFDMEVFSSNILDSRRGTYFFWGADKIEAINSALDEVNNAGLRIKKIYSVRA